MILVRLIYLNALSGMTGERERKRERGRGRKRKK